MYQIDCKFGACFRVTRLRKYKFRKTTFRGRNRFCHQSAARESSGQTDYIKLHHFSVCVFLETQHKCVLCCSFQTFLHFTFGLLGINM